MITEYGLRYPAQIIKIKTMSFRLGALIFERSAFDLHLSTLNLQHRARIYSESLIRTPVLLAR